MAFGWTFTDDGPGVECRGPGSEQNSPEVVGGLAKTGHWAPLCGLASYSLFYNDLDASVKAVVESGGSIVNDGLTSSLVVAGLKSSDPSGNQLVVPGAQSATSTLCNKTPAPTPINSACCWTRRAWPGQWWPKKAALSR